MARRPQPAPSPLRHSCAAPAPNTELDITPLRQQTNQCDMLLTARAPADERTSHDRNIVDNSVAKNYNSHSNDNLDEIRQTTDYVDSFRIPHKGGYARFHNTYLKNRCPHTIERNELHKNDDVLGNESISVRMKEEIDEYGLSRKAAHLQYECRRSALKRRELIWRPMMVHKLSVWIILGLLMIMLAASSAAPNSKETRSYLEQFGYLMKGRPEVGNLVHEDAAAFFKDDERIAIKTLQEFGGIPVTGVVDEATVELMKRRRCGRPDVEVGDGRRRKRFAVQGETWKYTNLTWSLSSSRRPSQLDPHATRAVLSRALDVWQQASSLTFKEINSDEADIVVSFAKRYHDDSYPFDGRGSILAHAFFPGTGRGGDAHFDDDELWLLQPKNDDEEGTSLFAVAVHEFGHSLGLSHSSVKGALMYPWYQGIQPNFVLPEDDRNGIQQMYGPKQRNVWGKIPYYRPEPPPPTTTTTTTTTTNRPYHHHHKHTHSNNPNNHPGYTPHPRHPGKLPAYYPNYRPSHYPGRRNSTDEHSRRTTYHAPPRPVPETTTHPTTYRPRYPPYRPDYPSDPRPYPSNPRTKKPYYTPRTTPRTTTPPPDKPDTCDTNYDAVSLIRGELFIFKNRYHWRRGAHGRYSGYPMEISRMWPDLPKNMTHVDAVYERPDRKIAFFIGKQLYLFDTQRLMPGYPRPISDLGLPEYLERLDAAMVWGHNGKTFFFSGTMYWKYDENDGRVEPDYPRDMSMWKGVGYNIDSVFQWSDGKTYFFKGKGYWKFNDLQMRVDQERQQASAPKWMGCSEERLGPRSPFRALPAPGSTLRSLSAASSDHRDHRYYAVVTSLLVLLASYITCS